MAIADDGELIVLAPGVREFGEDPTIDRLIRHYGYRGTPTTLEQVRREFLERPDLASNILAPVEEQCRWLRAIGFRDVDCFWKYFELAIFGGFR